MISDPLHMWTIFDHPADYPDHFVVRRYEVDSAGSRPTDDIRLYHELSFARAALESGGLTCIPRHPADDPCVVETWL